MALELPFLPFCKEILTEDGIVVLEYVKTLDKNHRVTTLLKHTIELLDSGNISAVLDLYVDKNGLMSDFTIEEIFIFKTVFFNTRLYHLHQYPNFECPDDDDYYGTCLPWIITELKNTTDIDFTSMDSLIANDKAMIKNQNVSFFYRAIFIDSISDEREDEIVILDRVKTFPNDHKATIMLRRAIELWESGNIADFLDIYSDYNRELYDFTIEELSMFRGAEFHTNIMFLHEYPKFDLSCPSPHGTCLEWIVDEIQLNTDLDLLEDN
ncbi:MAG: hypothetical protein FWG64_12785 [Firmicutes bacterium]|nr:hypothetical protein [Bacillota bacterium]